jgi:mannose-6-phosphate isomerase-like protein (cupin superfamily)
VQDPLVAVGPRLRALRQERDTTLAALSDLTGISISTLSRLESGRGRPPPARGGPDDLVGAGPTEDPRVVSRPINTEGMTIAPLSRRAGGIQAYKHLIPAGRPHPKPDPKTHEGYEWLYVLSGRLRLVVGELDLVLPPGEAAEFDCRTPHWFGRAGPEPVEFLSLFGPQGERMHVRARPASGSVR